MKVASLTSYSLVLSLGFFPVGCAVNSQSAYDDAQKLTFERTGENLQWNDPANRDPEIEKHLNTLLKGILTTTSAIQIALLNNRSIQATLEEVGISQADYVQATLIQNPSFGGSIGFPIGPPSAIDIGLSLTQNILNLFSLPLRKEIAATQLEQTKLRVTDEIIATVAEVKKAFFKVQAEYQLLERLRLLQEVSEAAAELAQRLHAAGNITDLDLANQQTVFSQSRADMVEAEVELLSDREQLNRLLGLWGKQIDWKVAPMLPTIPEEEITIEGVETLAVVHRLDLAAARSSILVIARALGLSESYRYLGTFEFGAGANRDTDGQFTVGPTLSLEIPIFNQGQGKIAQLHAKLRQAEKQYEAQAVNIRSEVRENRDRMVAKRRIALFYGKTLLPERMKIVNLTQLQVNAMQSDAFKLLQARRDELEAERRYVTAWRDYWIAHAALERSVGGSLILKKTSQSIDTKEPIGEITK